MWCLAGTDLTIATTNGLAALHIAIRRGDPAIVRSLLEHGAFVDVRSTSSGRTPLMMAMLDFRLKHRSDMELNIGTLFAADADLNAVDQNGSSALMFSVSQLVSSDRINVFQVPTSACLR